MSKNSTSPLIKRSARLIFLFMALTATSLPAADQTSTGKNAPKGVNDQVLNKLDIIKKLRDYYKDYNDYSAQFVQTTAHKMFAGKLKRAYGRVKFRKGGLMRWEYQRPENKLFIYDGKTLWVYQPEVPQIFEGSPDTERLRRALAFLTGQGNILKEYRTKKLSSQKFGFPQGYVLGLWPKDKSSPFEHVELYLDKSTFRVVRSVVVDKQGNRNRFDFFKMQRNTGIDKALFNFAKPAGVPVHKMQ